MTQRPAARALVEQNAVGWAKVSVLRRRHGSRLGGNRGKDASYPTVTPAKNDGTTVYTLKAEDVPVDVFRSISVYDEKGFFQKNDDDAYSVNSVTGKTRPARQDRRDTTGEASADGAIDRMVMRSERPPSTQPGRPPPGSLIGHTALDLTPWQHVCRRACVFRPIPSC
ncbi:hypothetical protein AB4099_34440 [Bosea sp. 2KB_26]|uniref:hypothetical protein n=1 Tax=Bosea sp. 2KB_26 TaxID=3237475 RepID=UPI003F91F8DF